MEFDSFVRDVLVSIGGATLLLGALSAWLGKVWAHRIAKQTIHKFELELQSVRDASEAAMAKANFINQISLEDLQSFGRISQQTYQKYFEQRLETYKSLLKLQYDYEEATADFVVDHAETWGDEFVRHYRKVWKLVGDSQIYLTAQLDEKFSELRAVYDSASKDKNLTLAYMHDDQEGYPEEESRLNNEVHTACVEAYKAFTSQLGQDSRRLRSRVDMDKGNDQDAKST